MKTLKITALAVVLTVAVAAAFAYPAYEHHMSSGYAHVFKAAMRGPSYEERAQYIHEASIAVRTEKDQEIQGKLEKLQQDTSGNLSPACQQLQYVRDAALQEFALAEAAYNRGQGGDGKVSTSLANEGKASDAAGACIVSEGKAMEAEVSQHLWPELRAAAGLPLN